MRYSFGIFEYTFDFSDISSDSRDMNLSIIILFIFKN